jgi:acetyl-CoA acetyltransferase family protein
MEATLDKLPAMDGAVIVDAVRTPLGRRNGMLAGLHPVELSAHVLRALVERNDLDPALVDDVIMGCVSQVGDQALNIGRNAVLAAGFPDTVPGTSIDRQCGSSQQALHFAAQGVMAGAYDVVIAAGVESMTRVPMGSSLLPGRDPFSAAVHERYPGLVPQGLSAELIAEKWALTRGELDEFSLESHVRAARAADEGRFEREIVGIPSPDAPDTLLLADEGIRRDTTLERLASLKPAFKTDGVVTAGNSSQITDGAAAVLVTSEEAAQRIGLVPRARLCAFALAGADPVLMLTAPIPATAKVLERGKLTLDDIDLVEINEAFASVVLAWAREVRGDLDRVNVNGGAIALGHPLGCSGARLTATLVCELERTGGRFGLQTMCEGGGMANAAIVERL